MKKVLFIAIYLSAFIGWSQSKNELLDHFKAYYNEMRLQGDVTGVISAMTHLNVLEPSKERKDTLAYIYANNNMYMQALNTVGIDKNVNDSDMAIQVKAISLKALNQPKRAIEQYEILYQRNPSPFLAYELSDLKIITGDNEGALPLIEYGIENSKDDMKYAFYERQQPYEVPLKAAFYHIKGLNTYNKDTTAIDEALESIDKALEIEPNFNLASLSKQALEQRKEAPASTEEN
jgi:tetratricopeptide (TPR) repeat protein